MSGFRKILFIGWDSADWKVITPLMDAGKMPHLQHLIERGVMGNMATLYPVLSPMLWTSIATGKRAHKHGIHGFAEPDPDTGGVRPITNLSRKTKAVWNILSQEGKKCVVVGWWPSHPAEPLPDGVMISNHYQRAPHNDPAKPWPMAKGTVHPERLGELLGEVRLHPGELDGEHILPFVPKAADIDQKKDRRLEGLAKTIADCTNIQAAATSLIQTEPWDFMAVYFDAIDHFGHGFMRYHPPKQKQVSEEDFEMYQGVIEAGYRYHDMMLGVLMAMVPPETTIVLMSDHGFHPDNLRPQAIPNEPAGPAVEHRHYGIFAMAGPGIKEDERIYGATLLDVCPTLLTLFGLPVGEDMDGKVLVTAWDAPPEIKTVPSWDAVEGNDGRHPPGTHLSPEDSKEAIKQLEELGYIQPLPEQAADAVAETERELKYNLACAYTDAQMLLPAARIFLELWERWPKEHRFGVKLLSAQMGMGRHKRARATLDKLRERQEQYAKESAATLKERKEGAWKDKKYEDLKPAEQHEMRQLMGLANVPLGSAKQFESMLLFAEGKPAEALAILEKMEKVGRASPEFYLRVGQAHRALKQWKEAESAYKKALKLDSDNAYAHLGMAETFLAIRRNYDAAGFALTATGLLYHYPSAHFALGVALHRLGHVERAAEAFQVCLRQNGNYLAAYRRLILIYENRLKDPAKADEYRKALEVTVARVRQARLAARERAEIPPPAAPSVVAEAVPTAETVPAFDPSVLRPARDDAPFITIVSGLPRSGTSLMMQMLVSGGLPALHDAHRPADEDNPRGYFEFAPAKNLRADASWMPHGKGRVLKLVAQLVPFLPRQQVPYRIIFMERSLDEVIASQRVMLNRHDRKGAALEPAQLKAVYEKQLAVVNDALAQSTIAVLRISHADAIARPREIAAQVAEFLALPLDFDAMASAIDPSLHRQRA